MLVGRLLGGTSVIACPSMKISPSLGNSKPAIMRRSVVLPQPEGPSSEKNSPWRIAISAASTAVTSPKRLVTAAMWMKAVVQGRRPPSCADPPLFARQAQPAHPFGQDHQRRGRHQDQRAQRQHRGQFVGEAQLAPDIDRQRRSVPARK